MVCRASSDTPLALYLPNLEAWALNNVTLSPAEIDDEQEEKDTASAGQGQIEPGRGQSSAGQGQKGRAAQRNAQPSITPLKAYPASISPFR